MRNVETAETTVEPLLTVKAAAKTLGLPYFKLRRAVARDLVPSYRLLNSRRLVRLSEIVTCIERTRTGGTQ
jgi:hypothetical protein